MDPERIAALWAELMAASATSASVRRGGDWGAMVTTNLARAHAARVFGIH